MLIVSWRLFGLLSKDNIFSKVTLSLFHSTRKNKRKTEYHGKEAEIKQKMFSLKLGQLKWLEKVANISQILLILQLVKTKWNPTKLHKRCKKINLRRDKMKMVRQMYQLNPSRDIDGQRILESNWPWNTPGLI